MTALIRICGICIPFLAMDYSRTPSGPGLGGEHGFVWKVCEDGIDG